MDNERRLMILASKMYYEDGLTQQEIAKKLDLSRIKISRLLQKAKESGVVSISIDSSGVYLGLEAALQERYNLDHVIIVDTNLVNSPKDAVASMAAQYLCSKVQKNATVAVGWGTTVQHMPQHMKRMEKLKLSFSPIIGGHGQSELQTHATTIASGLADATGGHSYSLMAPALVNTVAEKKLFMQNGDTRRILNISKSADFAVFSLGNPQVPHSSISMSGYLSPRDLAELQASDAICDVVSIRFLNTKGETCCEELTERCISLTPDELQAIANKICIVTGEEKKLTTKVAVEAGFVNVLICDQLIGEYLNA